MLHVAVAPLRIPLLSILNVTARRRFALLWLACFSLLLCLCFGFSYVVDPWGLHGLPRWQGFNAVKLRPDRSIGDIKLAAALAARPDAIILGNSRMDIGFDPAAPAWRGIADRPYNLGVPGAGIRGSISHLETLVHQGIVPRLVVVGLDPFDFLGASTSDMPRPTDGWFWRKLRLSAQSVATGEAFADSLRTVLEQGNSHVAQVAEDGFNPMTDYVALANDEGYFNLFRQSAQEIARRLAHVNRTADWHRSANDLAIDRLLAMAWEHGFRIEAVIYPFHLETHALIDGNELGPMFLDWRQTMAGKFRSAATGGAKVRLVDAAIFNEVTTEPIPPRGNTREHMQWYWDPGHFKKALGDRLLACLLPGTQEAIEPCSRSALVTDRPPEKAQYRDELLRWYQQRPEVLRDVQEILKTSLATVSQGGTR